MNSRILNIYHEEIPSFLHPYLASDAMQRLKGIDMNCGVNYTSFPLFAVKESYSRYEHSLGTALIAWHFTADRRQALAALFHDIASPAFSHAVDFLYGDHLRQEATEEKTLPFILNDEGIMTQLKEDGIAVSEVSDYHMYPVCDNDSPQLSADRLEYTCGNMIRFGISSLDKVREMYDDLTITDNEEGKDELAFQNIPQAVCFTGGALACGRIYSGSGHRFAMESLARILRRAMAAGILSEEDLYVSEAHVISRLENSMLQNDYASYTRLKAAREVMTETNECLKVAAKKRYIDPLVINSGRVSDIDVRMRKEIGDFLSEDYDVYLKGEYDE